MSEKIGKIVTCDRCGREIFLNYTGTSHLDGGFTRIEHFEKLPDGWRVRESYGKDYIMLCPDCNNEIDKLHKKFMIDSQIPMFESEAIKEVLLTLETAVEESDKYIREYEDSKEQRVYNKGLRDAYNLIKEITEEKE